MKDNEPIKKTRDFVHLFGYFTCMKSRRSKLFGETDKWQRKDTAAVAIYCTSRSYDSASAIGRERKDAGSLERGEGYTRHRVCLHLKLDILTHHIYAQIMTHESHIQFKHIHGLTIMF